jgi:hypothetical protein
MRSLWNNYGFGMGEHNAVGVSEPEEEEWRPEEGRAQPEQSYNLQMRILQQSNPVSYSSADTKE